MRTFHRSKAVIVIAGCLSLLCGAARAENRNYIINQNQTGISLPGVVTPNGFDEIRAADGTTCRAAMGGSGAYVDSGLVGGGLNGDSSALSAYGRVVVPLGTKPTRLDCDRLYQLELKRLQLEVKMLERGLDPRSGGSVSGNSDWAQGSEWTTKGRK
ncbi:hypothetical protein [Nitratireductor sp. ZSWI3]|uniref:hypothetical protein n=1 Tax=Nitratireductor sp. ZSWI3 TaxID=2966359 RepID=UPI00215036F6|nr:hypothetical protein [Nitratireductor sp. ZSWI3]MCR4267808.1 hypothetical protein [Nitratireductor sp. ZSWI3]